jgi:acyl carrier protein
MDVYGEPVVAGAVEGDEAEVGEFGGVMEGTVRERVLKVIVEETGYEVEDLKPNDNLQTDLGMDSLAMVNLQVELEAEFGIEMPDWSFRDVHTVGGLIEFVAREV